MTNYRRADVAGASYFFTVNLVERHANNLLVEKVDLLRQVFRKVKAEHPFHIDAIVILPEHLHCIWTLPPGDADYKTRWTLLKAGFFTANTCGGAPIGKSVRSGGTGDLATPLLGTPDT